VIGVAQRATATAPVLPGYTYVRPLGAGGFADVFLYEQDMPRRVVAVKVLISDAVDPDVLRAFNAEADIMARLSAHPSIVTIYQASISADGRPYFVMEYCPDTMSSRYKKARLSVAEVLDAGVRIAGALETAHRSGLLHRDIKPSNVLISSLGNPVLADFGIAAAVVAEKGESELFAMSIPWSSPEVLDERVSGSVQSEVWSLCATLYTLLAGHSPFELPAREKNTRDQISTRIAKAHYVPIGREDVPARVEGVLAKGMDRDPAKRQASLYALAEELRWAQFELGIAPTSLEAAAPEWAAAAAPISFSDGVARGPVISTVNKNSRRAARATAAAAAAKVDRDGLTIAPHRSSIRAGLLGAAIAVVAVVAVVVVVLFAVGIL
jgi:serine/threonine protein kinase